MAKTLYKIRDTVTKKFWSGDFRRSTFNDTGKTWSKKDGAESAVGYYLRHRSRWGTANNHSLPSSWELVEIELVEKETGVQDMQEYLKFQLLKAEVDKIDTSLGNFIEKMRTKKVLDKVEFLYKLKPAEGTRYITMDRIKEARAHMRQLGVKTGTFRESRGVFGMMDRQQALKARLVLDIDHTIDLGALRTKLGI